MIPTFACSQHMESDFAHIRERFCDPNFLACRGLGNEVPVFLYPYDASDELSLRAYVHDLTRDSADGRLIAHDDAATPVRVVHRDAWDILLSILRSRRILDKAPSQELRRGSDALLASIQKIATPDAFLESLDYEDHRYGDVVLVSGIGRVYPFMRAHSLLENAQHVFGSPRDQLPPVPFVMCYPGSWDGHTLRLFGHLGDSNYYRAFNII